MSGKIAIELEAYNIGKQGSIGSNKKCATKTRAQALGCKIIGTYSSNQLVPVNNLEANESYNYYLTFKNALGQSNYFSAPAMENRYKNFTIESYKKKVVNGVEDSTKIEVPFSASIPSGDSFVYYDFEGSSTSWYIHFTMNIEYPVASKSTVLVLAQSETGGKSINVTLFQEPAIVSYNSNTFDVASNSTSFGQEGGSFNLSVTSTVNVYINTKGPAVETNKEHPVTITGYDGMLRESLYSFTIPQNTGTAKNWNVTVIQDDTHANKTIRVSQAAGSSSTTYKFNIQSDLTNHNSAWWDKIYPNEMSFGKAYVLMCYNAQQAGTGYEVPYNNNEDLTNSYWMKLDKASQSSQYLTSGAFTYYSTGGVFRDLQSSNRQTVPYNGKVHCYAYINETGGNVSYMGQLTYIKYLGYFNLNVTGSITIDNLYKDW